MQKQTSILGKDSPRETEIQNDIRVSLSERGAIIWRNNVGLAKYADGSVVKYGLCNPGGSDLIGIIPVLITPDMVGSTLGRFVAVEVKRPGKHPTEDQENFIRVISENGGIAGIATTPEEALRLVMV